MKSIKDNWAALDKAIIRAMKNLVTRLNRAIEAEIKNLKEKS